MVGLAATDWPVGWSFWVEHPFWSALVPGLVLLLVAAAIVDAFLRRREARRWLDLGNAAATQLYNHFGLADVALISLLGVDPTTRTNPEWDYRLIPAMARAEALFPAEPEATDHWEYFDPVRMSKVADDRLPTLIRDEAWLGNAQGLLMMISDRQSDLLSRWAAVYAAMGDDRNFRRLTSTVGLTDLSMALTSAFAVAYDLSSQLSPVDDTTENEAVQFAISLWHQMRRDVTSELIYWVELSRDQSRINDPFRWRHQELIDWATRTDGANADADTDQATEVQRPSHGAAETSPDD